MTNDTTYRKTEYVYDQIQNSEVMFDIHNRLMMLEASVFGAPTKEVYEVVDPETGTSKEQPVEDLAYVDPAPVVPSTVDIVEPIHQEPVPSVPDSQLKK